MNGVVTWYVYDLSGNLIAEVDGTTGVVGKEYLYGITGRLATIEADESVYWHHNDHLGTPQNLTNLSGEVVWSMEQTPFGIVTVNEDVDGNGVFVQNNFRFPGQYFDSESGLNYNYFRTYDTASGRYTQHDPIGLKGGLGSYGYVGANPLYWIDPLGLAETVWINTEGGRNISDGPTNGNWGGKCWSGGQNSCVFGIGTAPALDSGDMCYKAHDEGWEFCGTNNQECSQRCDNKLVECLNQLPNDPNDWSFPPNQGAKRDSNRFKSLAIDWFN